MRLMISVLVLGSAMGSALAEDETVQTQAIRCWSPPRISADTPEATVDVRVDASGQVLDVGTPVDPQPQNPSWRAAIEATSRAIRRCAPYDVPAAGDYRVRFELPDGSALPGDMDPFTPLAPQ